MASSVTKKVRFDAKEARELRQTARELGLTESEVLRQGATMMSGVRKRRKNVEKLISLLGDDPEPPKVRYRVKW